MSPYALRTMECNVYIVTLGLTRHLNALSLTHALVMNTAHVGRMLFLIAKENFFILHKLYCCMWESFETSQIVN